jgi:hypothetical protein
MSIEGASVLLTQPDSSGGAFAAVVPYVTIAGNYLGEGTAPCSGA